MVFSSITFLFLFLPITCIMYYIPNIFTGNKKYKGVNFYKNIVLCIVSLIFYAWGEPINVVLMLISILFNYCIAKDMAHKRGKGKSLTALLIFSVIFNIGLLGFFKYSGFVADNISVIFGIEVNYFAPLLPIGISFYTFQILSYVIDVYRNKANVQNNILNFALYISMFPQLIAGPIVQYSDIENQLEHRTESFENIADGICVFVKGLVKKVVFANAAGAIYESMTAQGFSELSVLGAWTAILFYAFQIYFDFGGYSEMAIGLGRMFGFEFPVNFNHPYVATSITDFWRRWHISLSSWFRDYLYIPLGGSRCSAFRHIFNLFVVWSLTGLWHGASWNFVLWGIYYFILLVIEKYLLKGILEKIPAFIRQVPTFIMVLFGWVLFSCTKFSDLIDFFACMFGRNGLTDNTSIYLFLSNIIILFVMGIVSTGLFSYGKKDNEKLVFVIGRYIFTFLLFGISLMCLIGDTYNPFLYFRF